MGVSVTQSPAKFGTVNKGVRHTHGYMNSSAKIGIGAVLSVLSAALILYVSSAGAPILPGIVGSVAALVLALGVLLIGTSENDGRAV
jgi:hypothetical protein